MSLIAVKLRAIRKPFLGLLLLWILICIIWGRQLGQTATFLRDLVTTAIAIMLFAGPFLVIPQICIPIIGYGVWYAAAGASHLWLDLLIVLGVCIAGWFHFRSTWGKRLWGESKTANFAFGGILAVATWIAISTADIFFRPKPLAHDLHRLAALREESPYKKLQIGLALSGGGYRAALMHAGVLDGLERMGVTPTHLASVSGGSIISTFYTIGGKPDDFLRAVYQHRFNLARSVTNFYNAVHLACPLEVPLVHLRLLPFCEFGRSDVQAQNLNDILLDDVRLTDLRDQNLASLLICVTDMHTGAALAIGNHGVTLVGPGGTLNQYPFANLSPLTQREIYFELADSKEQLARVAAASGAFPGALSPLRLTHGDRQVDAVDGGVLDNSGINLLLAPTLKAPQPEWKLDLVLSSDAGAPFEQWSAPIKNEEAFINPLDQITRAMDILSNNGGIIPELHDQLKQPLLLLTPKQLFTTEAATRLLQRAESAAQTDERLKQLLDTWMEEFEASREAKKIANVPESQLRALGSLLRSVDMFRRASTLRDYYPQDEAKQLFQLGRFLVALSWTDIRCQLERGIGVSKSACVPQTQ